VARRRQYLGDALGGGADHRDIGNGGRALEHVELAPVRTDRYRLAGLADLEARLDTPVTQPDLIDQAVLLQYVDQALERIDGKRDRVGRSGQAALDLSGTRADDRDAGARRPGGQDVEVGAGARRDNLQCRRGQAHGPRPRPDIRGVQQFEGTRRRGAEGHGNDAGRRLGNRPRGFAYGDTGLLAAGRGVVLEEADTRVPGHGPHGAVRLRPGCGQQRPRRRDDPLGQHPCRDRRAVPGRASPAAAR
jgi:hypothetical protein